MKINFKNHMINTLRWDELLTKIEDAKGRDEALKLIAELDEKLYNEYFKTLQ